MGRSLRWAAACVLWAPAIGLAAPPGVEPPPAPPAMPELIVEEAEPPPAPLIAPPLPPAAPTKPPPPAAPSIPAAATPASTGVTLFNNTAGKLTIGGYAEFFYSYNFNNPPNSITAFRGFDNRHNIFTLSNAVLDTQYEKGGLGARIALQFGHTPNAIGLVEPTAKGAAGVGSSDGDTWKLIQQAYVGYKLPVGKGLLFQGGIFLTPVGLEPLPIKDNWNWSRSNLFFVLPYYHAGVRATQQITDQLSITAMVFNGWNNVIDSNLGKTIGVQLSYLDPEKLSFSVMYLGGPERADIALGDTTVAPAAEGQPWRNLFDAWVQLRASRRLWLGAHFDGGFELTNFGTSSWAAGAVYLRVQATRWLFLAGRGDAFWEHAAQNDDGTAARIFWPGDWVASGTGTIDFQLIDGLLARIEYRHDHGQVPMYYGELPPGTLVGTAITPTADSQNTLTVGVSAWF